MSTQSPFAWGDPFLLDDQLSEDERMMRDAAAAFAAGRLAARIEKAYMEEETDPAILREMGEQVCSELPFLRNMAVSAPTTSPTARRP